jgi:hypothetical protein
MSDWWSADPVASAPAAPLTDAPTKITVNKGPDYAGAISQIESGGRYDAIGPTTRTGDKAYGKYQVMGANVGPWTKEVFGQELTPQEFVANPQVQDAVFQHKFGKYAEKYGAEGASRAWFAGEKGMHNPNARDILGTRVAEYSAKFSKALGRSSFAAEPKAAAQAEWWANDPVAGEPAAGPTPADAVQSRFGEFAPVPDPQAMEQGLNETAPVKRGTLLPVTHNLRTGESFFDLNSGLTGAVKRAVMLPGQVASGEIKLPSEYGIPGSIPWDDPRAKESFRRVQETAMLMSPTSVASRAGMPAAAPSVAPKAVIPEVSAVKQAAQQAYKAADDAGVVISQQRYGDLAGNIAKSVREAGFHPKIHPKVAGALEEVAATVGKTPTLSELEIVRRIAQSAASSIEKDERRVARVVVDKIDDFVKTMTGRDVVAGDAQVASKAIFDARTLWAKSSKAEAIEGLVEKAKLRASQFSGSGYENALRTEFRKFAGKPAAMRGFSSEEQAAIRKVAEGGKVDNLFRYLGKMAPTGIVSAALSGGGGFAAAGPVGAVAAPIVGAVSRAVATKRTEANAKAARDLILTEKTAAPAAPIRQAPSVDRARKLFESLLKPSLIAAPELVPRRAR